MSVTTIGRCIPLLVIALGASASARTATEPAGNAIKAPPVRHGRTINGYTYTDAPVQVKLGPNTFRIPANYFDSQIGPFGEGLSLKLEWPDMTPTAPGARAAPRTNDFRKEISVLVDYIDRLPIEGAMRRRVTNDGHTDEGALERRDPAERLELRIAQPERMGLTPYTVDQGLRAAYAKDYHARYGRPLTRNLAFEPDWYVARSSDGEISTFIKCDNADHRADGVVLDGDQVVSQAGVIAAGCTHYMVDLQNSLSISLSYKRAFLKDWKRMETAVRDVLARYRVK
ncbi:hypothetical protein [Stenotrophomonas rhizophila]|uniref:hypothetical protein n=1 Tax=Stenotrophomonas rhizophila TaxID=216778 RepID=UPI001E282AB9|nr:hypothetical protein [Stenotrophomonas rhizophila]MCC7634190.1 hypothetical protein [Stenotrophomonas rhizophila]MCC7662886.1 hypothetical protein [Stenotrophomonas rhizophila]